MTELTFDKLDTRGDTDCTRDEFLYASRVLDGEIVSSGEEREDKVEKILRIARRTAMTHGIPLGTPTTSKEILSKLKGGTNTQTIGVSQIVRQKIYGIIGAASADELVDAINTLQKGKKRIEVLSVDLVLLLGKIQLQEYRMTDLAKYSGTTTAAITGTADRLDKLGYVLREKSTTDRRVIFLRLTEEGQKLLSKIEAELTK